MQCDTRHVHVSTTDRPSISCGFPEEPNIQSAQTSRNPEVPVTAGNRSEQVVKQSKRNRQWQTPLNGPYYECTARWQDRERIVKWSAAKQVTLLTRPTLRAAPTLSVSLHPPKYQDIPWHATYWYTRWSDHLVKRQVWHVTLYMQ